MSSTGNTDAGTGSSSTGKEIPPPDKLAKIGLLVAGISHNLYGPLTGIMGTLDLLKMKHPDMAKDLERVSGLARRLQDEIRVMLHKAEIEYRGSVVMIELAKLVEGEIEFYKGDPRFKHMTEITFEPPENLPSFRASAGDFTQSISNIFANAIEAMEESEKKELTIALAEEGGNLVLKIADTGIGMDEETLAHAFDPFFTTKTPVVGGKFPATLAQGLGLTHAKNLLDSAGVALDLSSKQGEGTTVTLTIPYKDIDSRHASL